MVARYGTAARAYAIAVKALAGKNKNEFDIAFREAERLRISCEEEWTQLDRHSIEHGCGAEAEEHGLEEHG